MSHRLRSPRKRSNLVVVCMTLTRRYAGVTTAVDHYHHGATLCCQVLVSDCEQTSHFALNDRALAPQRLCSTLRRHCPSLFRMDTRHPPRCFLLLHSQGLATGVGPRSSWQRYLMMMSRLQLKEMIPTRVWIKTSMTPFVCCWKVEASMHKHYVRRFLKHAWRSLQGYATIKHQASTRKMLQEETMLLDTARQAQHEPVGGNALNEQLEESTAALLEEVCKCVE